MINKVKISAVMTAVAIMTVSCSGDGDNNVNATSDIISNSIVSIDPSSEAVDDSASESVDVTSSEAVDDSASESTDVTSSEAVDDSASESVDDNLSDDDVTIESTNLTLPEGNLSDWNLIFLNPQPENRIEVDMEFEKMYFGYEYVDARAGVYYEQMCDDASKEGITLFLRSGYRSMATQATNYNNNVARLEGLGNTYEQAVAMTNMYYTVAGHSEHHSGLAFDIITTEYHNEVFTLSEKFAETEAYEWLVENCADYGFILRYTEDKIDITTINYEPWHYRFVGVEHAQYITENNLCYEEYIELLVADGR